MRAISLLLLIAIACCLAGKQGSATGDPQPRMVMLHVRVTDSSGRAVVDVPQSSLVVTEDGVPQKIEVFIKDDTPLSYGLMIDSSGSVRSQYLRVITAAQQIVESNRPTDETFLIRFISSDKIEVAQEPTSDKALLLKSLDDLYIEGGSSAVIDAVYLSAEKLAQQKIDPGTRRRALVLLSDGEDRDSYYKPEKLFNLLASTDVQIFTIALTGEVKPENRNKAINLLTRLGGATGGQTFFPTSAEEIERISRQLLHEIRTEYVIGYVPSGIDAGKDFHKVHVTITDNPNQDKRASITRVAYRTQN